MKKKYPYLLVTLITCFVFLCLFYFKGIFPFGENSLIYGDMHDQITAFYYHMYDFFKGDTSLLVNFTTSGGVNFFGILTYYILSPFSLILLLFEREKIYLAVSIVIALKCLTAGLTFTYAIRYLFKEKLSVLLQTILALSYAFSGYFFCLYQITPWMDAMYLLPLVMIGLKKVLDLDKPYFYIITLTLSLITSFYVTLISIIFIFFISLFYILVYVDKDNRKKSILALGITTVIPLLLSFFILYPSILQMLSSSRVNVVLSKIFNSKTGPLTDKISFFFPTMFPLICILFLLIKYKDNKKFLKFIIPTILVLFLPYIIEPINKLVHFGTYAMFPNRYGYMLFFFINISAAYFLSNNKINTFTYSKKIRYIFAVVTTVLMSISSVLIIYMNYSEIQLQIYKLTLSYTKMVPIILLISSLIIAFALIVVFLTIKKDEKLYYPLIFVLVITQIFTNSFIYLGIDHYNYPLNEIYTVLNEMEDTYKENDYYRVKNNTVSLLTNIGMVMKYPSLDHFTSLVDDNNLTTLKLLGYKSYWTKTFSKNSTAFLDVLLAHKYYITKNTIDDDNYKLITEARSYNLYELNKDISYGYFTKNVDIIDKDNTLDLENEIYKAITNKDEDIIKIYNYDEFDLKNVKLEDKKKLSLSIIDKDITSYLEKNIKIKDKSIIYLEIYNSNENTLDTGMFDTFDIYINDKRFISDYPNKHNNGTLKLGEFENEEVSIKIELNKNVKIKDLELGIMEFDKLDSFVSDYKVDSKIDFNRNKITVNVNNDEKGLFFIPITYDDNYKVKVNGVSKDVIKVYDNFLGVELDEGKNEIEFTYIPGKLIIGIIVSIITLILTIFLFKFKIYNVLINNNLLTKIISYIYLFLYVILTLFIYIIPSVCFILSYFMYIN